MKHLILIILNYITVSILCKACGSSEERNEININDLKHRIGVYLHAQQFEIAIKACDSIFEVQGYDSWTVTRKAVALNHLSRYKESINLLNEAILLDSSSSEAYYWRGNGRKMIGDTSGAIMDYSVAVTIDPQLAVAYNNRGNLLAAQNKNDSAISDFIIAVKIDSTFSLAWSNLSIALTRVNLLDSALKCYSKALLIKPTSELYYGRGLLYYKMKYYDLALSDYTNAINLDPTNSVYYLHRSFAYAELNRRSQMCEDLKSSWNLGNEEARRYYLSACEHK